MKVFIGSSTEMRDDLRLVSSWVEELQMEPLPWDDPGLFLPGDNTFLKLIEIAKQVDAAIFLFGEDDRVWYRTDGLMQPRDNVLLEYGLFASRLGPRRAIICRKGAPKTATDLHGITFITLDHRESARVRLLAWARSLSQQTQDPAVTDLILQREVVRRERDELKERLDFELRKTRELQRLLRQFAGVDLEVTDTSFAGQWKLLFDYDYFWLLVNKIQQECENSFTWGYYLFEHGLQEVVDSVEQPTNESRLRFFIAKTLRVIRRHGPSRGPTEFAVLLQNLDEPVRAMITAFAGERMNQLRLKLGTAAEEADA